ncbi:GNAT family N-acetyltransferase [Streptosporangium sp. DT93]|uniref:GNAT family N-acetyltransferase n=1 Tax=Streptosporangium sp. DT93 TaxID=3393428 RepID=UPI003CEE823E
MPETSRLSDGTVTLTPLCLDDVEAHLAGEDDQLVRWLNGGPGTRAGVEAHIRRCMEQWSTGGPVYAFGVRVGMPETLAGTVEVQSERPDLLPGQVNISYGLYPAWRGRGIATRAVGLACLHAATIGASEAVIKVDPENTASTAVAGRAGFTYLKQARDSGGDRFNWYVRTLAAYSESAEPR